MPQHRALHHPAWPRPRQTRQKKTRAYSAHCKAWPPSGKLSQPPHHCAHHQMMGALARSSQSSSLTQQTWTPKRGNVHQWRSEVLTSRVVSPHVASHGCLRVLMPEDVMVSLDLTLTLGHHGFLHLLSLGLTPLVGPEALLRKLERPLEGGGATNLDELQHPPLVGGKTSHLTDHLPDQTSPLRFFPLAQRGLLGELAFRDDMALVQPRGDPRPWPSSLLGDHPVSCLACASLALLRVASVAWPLFNPAAIP